MIMEFIGQIYEQKGMFFIKTKTLKINNPGFGPRGVFQFTQDSQSKQRYV